MCSWAILVLAKYTKYTGVSYSSGHSPALFAFLGRFVEGLFARARLQKLPGLRRLPWAAKVQGAKGSHAGCGCSIVVAHGLLSGAAGSGTVWLI